MEESSDEEYFPTTEELEGDDVMETDEDDEEDQDDENDEEYMEEDEEDEEDEDEAATVERIIQISNPGILRQLQQAIHRGIALRQQSNASNTSSHEENNYPRRVRRRLQQIPDPPFPKGRKLLNSGDFGEVDDPKAKRRRYEGARTITQLARFRELGWRKESTLMLTKKWIPPEKRGRIVAQYDRHVYSGQFSHDGSFFYTASQDFKCRMYSTLSPSRPKEWKLYKVRPSYSIPVSITLIPSLLHFLDPLLFSHLWFSIFTSPTSLVVPYDPNIQTVRGEIGRWTITDATLSHDNRFLAYSSITPCVYFARTGSTSSLEVSSDAETWKDGLGPEENQTVLDFSGYNGTGRFPRYYTPNERDRMDPRTGIWSLRFSADGRELVAGASDQCLYGIVPGTLVFELFLGCLSGCLFLWTCLKSPFPTFSHISSL
jgi:WD repeat-containing protein 23